jgi:hypothetical protein
MERYRQHRQTTKTDMTDKQHRDPLRQKDDDTETDRQRRQRETDKSAEQNEKDKLQRQTEGDRKTGETAGKHLNNRERL